MGKVVEKIKLDPLPEDDQPIKHYVKEMQKWLQLGNLHIYIYRKYLHF